MAGRDEAAHLEDSRQEFRYMRRKKYSYSLILFTVIKLNESKSKIETPNLENYDGSIRTIKVRGA
jgi:hypothetical protein